MKLTFNEPYLSISSLSETQLPTFAIITGSNGSGKTHLLQAFGKGAVVIEGLEPPVENQVKLFDWNSFVNIRDSPREPGEKADLRGIFALLKEARFWKTEWLTCYPRI